MPTYSELLEEKVWRDEKIPPALHGLRNALMAFYDLGPGAIGIRGDNRHLSGGHRSRNWLIVSRWATNRSYTVTETDGNKWGGDGSEICAMDITINRARLLKMCQWLDIAVRAGIVEKVAEWYGNTNGDMRVDGYNNIRNALATSDSSHLWHLHMTFDRGKVSDDHTDLFRILTGQGPGGPNVPGMPKPPVDMEWTEKMLRNAPTIKKGASGDWVKTAQGLLNARGFAVKVDGDFGPKTDKATRDLQRKIGAELIDGEWGPETWTIGFTGSDGL